MLNEETLKKHFPDLQEEGEDLSCTCPICDTQDLVFSPIKRMAFCFTCNIGTTSWEEAIAVFKKRSGSN
jgi:hypothetical protein